jgi:hypothetical protein
MRSSNLVRLFVFVVLAGLLTGAAVAQQPPAQKSQPPGGQPPPQPPPAQPATEGQATEGEAPDAGQVEGVAPEAGTAEPVPEGIELVEGSGFRYDARGRRDPFVSLAAGLNILPPDMRPPGLSGMLIQEVSLHGIVKTAEGYIAMIQGTDNKSYFARIGERLYDGTIDVIDDEKVVFLQEINDPLRIEKFHRIEKSLHPVEEGK